MKFLGFYNIILSASIYISSLYILCACNTLSHSDSNSESGDENLIRVDVSDSADTSVTDFIKSVHHINLETNDSCLVSKISRIQLSNDTIFLQSGKEIFTFDKTGNLIAYFMHFGQGPKEYHNINSLRVKDGIIYVLDAIGKKIISFTPSGEYLNSIKLDYSFIDFYIPDDKHFVLASGNTNYSMHNFIWVDKETGETTNKYAPYGIVQTVYFHDYLPFAGLIDGKIIVNTPFCHTNFALTVNSYNPFHSYFFNTEQQLPQYDPMHLDIAAVDDELSKNIFFFGVVHLGYYSETQTASYLSFELSGRRGGFLPNLIKFNKNENQIGRILFGFDLFKDYPYLKYFNYIEGDKMVAVRNADELIAIDHELDSDYWESQGLTEDSNPVVFVYTLK